MKIGDKIFITGGPFNSTRTTVKNVLDNEKMIVRVGLIDVMINKKNYVKVEEAK